MHLWRLLLFCTLERRWGGFFAEIKTIDTSTYILPIRVWPTNLLGLVFNKSSFLMIHVAPPLFLILVNTTTHSNVLDHLSHCFYVLCG